MQTMCRYQRPAADARSRGFRILRSLGYARISFEEQMISMCHLHAIPGPNGVRLSIADEIGQLEFRAEILQVSNELPSGKQIQ